MEDSLLERLAHVEEQRWKQLLTIMGSLVVAAILGGVATYASVKALDTNVSLFRMEVRREFDIYQAQIRRIESKIDQLENGR